MNRSFPTKIKFFRPSKIFNRLSFTTNELDKRSVGRGFGLLGSLEDEPLDFGIGVVSVAHLDFQRNRFVFAGNFLPSRSEKWPIDLLFTDGNGVLWWIQYLQHLFLGSFTHD